MNRDERNAAMLLAFVLTLGALPFIALAVCTSGWFSLAVYLVLAAIAGVWFVCTEPRP